MPMGSPVSGLIMLSNPRLSLLFALSVVVSVGIVDMQVLWKVCWIKRREIPLGWYWR